MVNNADEIDSPALVVFPERVRQNIRTAVDMVKDVSLLRPHVKTHKSPDATRCCLDAGIRRFKCATIAEAEMLARCGAPDVLLAYQPVGPKIARLLRLHDAFPGTTFSCTLDDPSAAKGLSEGLAGNARPLSVFIDVNIGMNRTGTDATSAGKLFRECASLPGIAPAGLHAYDGHISDPDPAVREKRCMEAFAPVVALAHELRAEAGGNVIIAGGGSPTFPILARGGTLQCSPGTFVLWDQSYAGGLKDIPFMPAAVLMTRVVSHPAPGLVCLDLGHKSVASEKDLAHRVHFLNAPSATPVSHSEEHMIVKADDADAHPLGEVWYGIPYHVCPTCALYERAVTVVDGDIAGEWRITARDRRLGV